MRVFFYYDIIQSIAPIPIENNFICVDDVTQADIVIARGSAAVDFCASLRQKDSIIGIIFISDDDGERLKAYETGADDCVTTTVCQKELLQKAAALCKRVELCRNVNSDITVCGGFYLDRGRNTLVEKEKGRIIELTQIEYRIIECFFNCPNLPLDRQKILSNVWNGNYYGEEKVVDVNIRRLRIKIEEDSSKPLHLVTVWGKGYMWKT